MELSHARVSYRLKDLIGHLPSEVIEKMMEVKHREAIVTYKDIEFFVDPHYLSPEYSRERHEFYILLGVGEELPECLRGLKCQAVATGQLGTDIGVSIDLHSSAAIGILNHACTIKIRGNDWGTFKSACRSMKELAESMGG